MSVADGLLFMRVFTKDQQKAIRYLIDEEITSVVIPIKEELQTAYEFQNKYGEVLLAIRSKCEEK